MVMGHRRSEMDDAIRVLRDTIQAGYFGNVDDCFEFRPDTALDLQDQIGAAGDDPGAVTPAWDNAATASSSDSAMI